MMNNVYKVCIGINIFLLAIAVGTDAGVVVFALHAGAIVLCAAGIKNDD